ncbi:hypothetical protein GCM10011391_14490 [Pullulanibacillus camelliae]|uniref:Uncharacterized protein n=1 Tax=Pullulanibacillus camelliae TaxID=1707096 RepID=A0A8J2VLN7_9BACL|nr:hypothetical protein GCM10011391_14490 [Pullulanibacillus camelliae]
MGIPIEVSLKKMAVEALTEDAFADLLASFRTLYKQYESEWVKPFNGISEVLDSLKRRGKRLFVLSSKHSEVLKRNLVALGIFSYFEGYVVQITSLNTNRIRMGLTIL